MKHINLMLFLLFTPFLWSNEALLNALKSKDIEKAKEIIQNDNSVDVNIKDKHGDALLIVAIRDLSNLDIVKLLIEKGADANIKDDDGKSALCMAVYIGNKDIFFYLIKSGALVDVIDNFGGNLLHCTIAEKGNIPIETILDHMDKAFINKKDFKGYTPLHKAIAGDIQPFSFGKEFIENGADINIKNNESDTALHCAVRNHDYQSVRLLLANGADVDIRNDYGKLAKDYAKGEVLNDMFTHVEKFNKTRAELEKIKNIKIKTLHEERIDTINSLLFNAIFYTKDKFSFNDIKDLSLAIFPLEIFSLIFSYLSFEDQLKSKELAKRFYMLVKNDPKKLKERIQRLPIYEKIYYLRKLKVKDIPPAIRWCDFNSFAADLEKFLELIQHSMNLPKIYSVL